MCSYLKIKNWESFQHYKDREPPWIKLHRSLLNDYEFSCLLDSTKGHLVMIWLYASQNGGRIPNDSKFLMNKLGLQSRPDLGHLINAGFLLEEENASNALAICTTASANRKQLEAEAEKDKTEAEAECASAPPDGLNLEAWGRWVDYRKKVRKAIKPVSMLAAQRELAGFGVDQAAVVEQSIAHGWQGLFELKHKQKANGNGNGSERWWASEASVLAKGRDLKMAPKPGESLPDFKGRIQVALDRQAAA